MSSRALIALLGLVLGAAACGIKGPPRPPAEPPPPSSAPPPSPAAGTQPQGTQRDPLPSSIPPPDAGTP